MADISGNSVIINDREQLKKYFRSGMLPSEVHFAILIDSMFNKVDDGINKNSEDGLMIFPSGDEEVLLSFYDSLRDKRASWVLVNAQGEAKGIILKEKGKDTPTIFFQNGGNVGIGTDRPSQKLEVAGMIASHGRVGVFHKGTIPADGNWHDVLTGLTGCQGFEIIAHAGRKQKGKYSLLHATAVSTYGNSKPKINKTCAHYGLWWNKIDCRWTGGTFNYKLQMRTGSNYGGEAQITFRIGKLWDDDFLNEL
ncbi:adhesin [Algoriphagus sp. NG3]|uniref:adhesin n=1 Tax=unclassified Algoriphagus TaxID=2641541 RepID=UPI002A800D40|nr:adhesin [Algoriphagus sp. NG3]WPR77336.1 adhesin [Algoriphagus sp. NG3]